MEAVSKQPFPVNPKGGEVKGIRGQIVTFTQDPFLNQPEKCYKHYEDGFIVIQDGKILDVGEFKDISGKYPMIKNIDHYTDSVIMPGFVDCHVHYVQSPMIGSFGDTLLDWLNNYTFPTEEKYADKAFADEVAKVFFKQILQQGTTTANVFSTSYATSVDAFFEESERYNTRMISGKVFMDRNVPDKLKDASAEESIAIAEDLLKKWHNRGRQLYAVIPRFAPTSTEKQMTMMGDLYQRHIDDGVYMHTHLNEAEGEVSWVAQLFPQFDNYTDVYKAYGLVDRHSIMAHSCLMKDEEWNTLYMAQCSCAHCPSSNLFLGDGEFQVWKAKDPQRPVRVGMGTDVGGGTNFSIPRQLNEAYKVSMLFQKNLSALHSFYLATRGGAEALHLEKSLGSIEPGFDADIAVLDLKASEFMEWRMQFTKDIFDKLFVLQTLALDNMNKATYVYGNKVFDRSRDGHEFMYANEFNSPTK
ncbi:MAG: guanine deaminase [Marinifilaceae bacterium]